MRRVALHRNAAPAGPGPLIQVCQDSACRHLGAEALLDEARRHRLCRVEAVPCVGLCHQAPALLLHGAPEGGMSPAQLDELLADAGIA